jgi:hypothetical protein
MAVRERVKSNKRDRLVAELLEKFPPIQRLEELMGPEPAPEEAEEVDAFLRARAQWQQPYSPPKEMR